MKKYLEILRNEKLECEEKINFLQDLGLDLEDILELALNED